jgi:hypothetical protein
MLFGHVVDSPCVVQSMSLSWYYFMIMTDLIGDYGFAFCFSALLCC